MPIYSYKGVTADGKIVTGKMDCPNDLDLESRLSRQGLQLIRAREIKLRPQLFSRRKVSRQDMITFCFQMEQLAAAGIPLLEGLIDLRDTLGVTPLRAIVADLAESIEGGLQLSEAVKRHPQVFNPVMASLIQVGEASGELPRVFGKLTRSLKWEDELMAQTRKLLIYPAFAGTVVLAVALFLLLYLVPQLTGFIKSMHQELPVATVVMVELSNFLRHDWHTILIALAGTGLGFFCYTRSSTRARYRSDRWILGTWLVGPIIKKISVARFTGYFSMMYSAGITVLEALHIGQKIVGNLVIEDAIRLTRENILAGKSMGDSFQSTGIFPPLVLRMVRIGEATGDLDKALDNVNYFYEREVKESIAQVQALIEPSMTVVLGLLLGGIMFGVLGPIYDIISKIKI